MTDPSKPRSLRAPRIAVVLVVLGALFVAHRLGLLERFAEAGRVKETLIALGPWGYLAFVLSYGLIQPFGIPGTVFILAATLIWPWPIAFALSMVGTMAATTVGFSFARFVARDSVARFIPARFKKYDEALARRAFATVFFLRLVFWMSPLLHAFLGLSKVRFSTHFWGSLAGYILPVLLVSLFGERLFDTLRRAPIEAWIAVGFAVVTGAVVAWWRRRRPHAPSQ